MADRRRGGRSSGNTRWWLPFCLVVDWVAATIIAVEIIAGTNSTTNP